MARSMCVQYKMKKAPQQAHHKQYQKYTSYTIPILEGRWPYYTQQALKGVRTSNAQTRAMPSDLYQKRLHVTYRYVESSHYVKLKGFQSEVLIGSAQKSTYQQQLEIIKIEPTFDENLLNLRGKFVFYQLTLSLLVIKSAEYQYVRISRNFPVSLSFCFDLKFFFERQGISLELSE